MLDLIDTLAAKSNAYNFFYIGMGIIYFTGFMLLIAVLFKFWEHNVKSRKVEKDVEHPFSTLAMTLFVVFLFNFWLMSYGQLIMPSIDNNIYFAIGLFMVVFATVWHIWAKFDIGTLWSDAIEIKEGHIIVTTGAYKIARHPMYASLLMWCFGASLMMFNIVTLALVGFVFLPLMIKRARSEEKELLQLNQDYALYQQNVRMLFPTISGIWAVIVKLLAICLLGYYIYTGIDLERLVLLFFIHLYLGYSLMPEKVAFSYRSKSGMMIVFWLLSLLWQPFYYMFYLILIMFIYGMKWNCPCMIVYNKYQRCPCFALFSKCKIK